jgi:hypothetical protein
LAKGGGKTVQTSQTSSPWATQVPYLEKLFKGAEGLYGQNTVAAQSPYTQQAIQQRAAEAGPGSLTGQAQGQISDTLAGKYANPYSSAALGDMLDMAKARTNAQFGGDNYGNSAHQEWLSRNMTTAAAPYASQLFENERGRQMQAAQMAPGISDAGLGQLQQAGQMQDVYAQRQTDSPWEALQRYQGLTAGNYGGTTTGTQPYQQSNPFADILGTALGGAGLYRMLATPIPGR